jgi:hypothetical protein
MVALLMIGILALLLFLCISHTIPGIVQSRQTVAPRNRRRPAERPRAWGSSSLRARRENKAGIQFLVEKS